MSKYKPNHRNTPSPRPPIALGNNITLLRTQGTGNAPRLAREAFKRGSELRKSGNLPEAMVAFQEALTASPNYLEASNELGLALIQANELSQALALFKSAVEAHPSSIILLNNLGATWLKIGDFAEGVKVLEQAVQRPPLAHEVQINLEIARRELKAGHQPAFTPASVPAPGGLRISLCLIAKNEAANLPRLFRSVQGAVDEIVVVDTGSTDDTVAIARNFNARVIVFPWRNDFATAKNEGIQAAIGDWILFLDADMALHEGHAAKIRQAVASGAAQSYYVNINSPLSDGVSEDIIAQPWLFRRAPGVKFEGAIHETVYDSLMANGFQPAQTDIVVYHFGYAKREDITPRFERNLIALRKEVESDTARPISYYYLGTTLLGLNRPAEAILALKRAIAFPDLYWRVRANAHLALIRAYAANGEPEAAGQSADEAIALYPKDRMAWTFRGEVATKVGLFEKAIESFEQALNQKEVLGAEGNVQRVTDAGLERDLAEALAHAGRLGDAITHYERALQCGLPPAAAETTRGLLAFILFTQNHSDAAKQQANVPFGEPAWDAIETIAIANGTKERVGEFCRWLESNGFVTDSVRARLGLQPREEKAYVASLIDSARALREAGNLVGSIAKVEQAIALAPLQPGLHYELGAIYAMAGDRVRAARAYVAELSVVPNHAPSAHDIGVLYAQEGEYGEAVSWLELALTLDPNNATTKRHLAEVRQQPVATS